jgi:chemotaxis protein histidine kinase CheA
MAAALHAGEDLLEALRAGELALDRTTIDLLLELVGASNGLRLPRRRAVRHRPALRADAGLLLPRR